MIGIQKPTILIGKNYVYLIEDQQLLELKSIEDLKKNINPGEVNLLLANDMAYFQIFSFPLEEEIDKARLSLEFQKQTPLNLDEVVWKYQLLEKNKKTQEYWAFVPESNSLLPFLKALEKNKFEIESVSFLPFLIFKTYLKNPEPTLIIFQKNKISFLLVINRKKLVIYNLTAKSDLKTEVSNLITSLKKYHQLEIKKVIAISDQNLTDLKLEAATFDFSKFKFIPLIKNYQPQVSQEKTQNEQENSSNNIKNKHKQKELKNNNQNKNDSYDTDDVNDDSKYNISDENTENETKNSAGFLKKNKNLLGLILLLTASLIFMIAVIWLKILKNPQSEGETISQLEQTSTDQEINTNSANETTQNTNFDQDNTLNSVENLSNNSSPEAEFFANLYSVQILNGTTRSGLASQVQNLLKENDFDDLSLGNASKNNYQTTQIITTDNQLRSHLIKILEKEFQINPKPEDIDLPKEFDAIIILGQN